MPITPLPTLDRTSATFRESVDTFFGSQLPAFAGEANALQVDVNAKQAAALSSADTAYAAMVAADASKLAAAASAATALADKNLGVTARAGAEAALDSFDDRYLGAKAAAPTLDNDGNALLTGALYWDTTIPGMRAYNNAAWVTVLGATAGAITNTPAGNIAAVTVQAALNELDTEKADKRIATLGCFVKADPQSVAFTKTANATISLKAGTYIDVVGTLLTFATATAVVMPALAAGTDYAVYACTDGTIRADASFSAPSGYTTANSRKIGGFHYAPGGHSGVSGGGNATPQINEYSLWDLKFKPACLDPRGMALVADGFWADIYLLGVDHLINGSSKYNVTIADGASPPKVPTKFGGNGTTGYTSLNWWEAGEVMAHHGKRLPSYTEFAGLAFGTTEATSIGADPVSTTWAAAYISKWGCAQVSGNLWQWGANFGGGTAAAGWVVNTVGRGSTYQLENAALFGGSWDGTSNSGSRCSYWTLSPTFSGNSIGSRGVCDLLILE